MKGTLAISPGLDEARPLCLAAGVFDGVHRGHRAVIQAARREAERIGGVCWVLTFDQHPRRVVGGGASPPLLTNWERKMALFRALGVEGCFLLRFTPSLAALTPIAFLQRLRKTFPQWRMISVGADWRFGRQRKGDVALLRRFGARFGLRVEVIPPVRYRGEPISSTRIREALRRGAVRSAAAMLGRPFVLTGRVIRGAGVGRRLGFPTANLRVEEGGLLGEGVYAVRVQWGRATARPAVMNVGRRPTVAPPGSPPVIEIHVPGFRGRLYGRRLEVEVIRRLRSERRFPNPESLRRQIERDCQAALRLLTIRRRDFPTGKKIALQGRSDGL